MTQKQKHTPGPWGTDYTGNIWGDEENPKHDPLVASVFHSGMPLTDEQKANAHLIAAAPQMKALIEKAVDALATYIVPDSGITEHEVVNTLLGIFDGPEYRAAIAKATGQAA